MTSKLIFYQCEITPEKNCIVDDLTSYLNSLTSQIVNDFQYIKFDLDLYIKVNSSQVNVPKFNYNYVAVKNSDVDKVYYAEIDGKVTREDAEHFLAGVDIGDEKKTMPAVLEILSSADRSRVLLTIREGRFHQVKRMFHAAGKEVLFLKRIQMGSLKLDERLSPGEYRRLTKEEVEKLC